jgi:acyl-CoA thioester hydrolase
MENHFVAETTFRVRYVETDAQGFVHHKNYLVYFEEARSAYLRQRGHSYAEFEQAGYFLVVAEANLRYIKALKFDQQVTIRTWITELKSRALTYQYEVWADDQLCATGTTRHLCITREGQIATIPAFWRTLVQS